MCRADASRDERRMDLVISDYPRFGCTAWLDFSVICPIPAVFSADTHLIRTVTPGAASAQYARTKQATYRDLYSASPSVAFTPAIVDIFGHFHDSFLCFARELATYTVSSTVSEDVASSASASQGSARLLHRWLQRLSVSLQRDQASQILMLAGARSELQSPFRSTHVASLLLASTDIRPTAALH